MTENIPLIVIVTLVVIAALWLLLRPAKTTPPVAIPEPEPEAPAIAVEKPAPLVAPPTSAPEVAVKAKVAPKAKAEPKAKATTKPKVAAPKAEVVATPPAAKTKAAEPKAKVPAKKASVTKAKTPKVAADKVEAPAKAPVAKPAAKTPVAKTAPTKAAAKPAAPKAAKLSSSKGPDNLLWIKGLGPKINNLFVELGVTRFDQIAAWSADDIAAMDVKLGNFAGRIGRDNFVEQAQLLAKGDVAAFEAKYGKLDSENR
jgi:predicted flap endonuclease-1-like 5' DNA nuclease